jgi:hypothetical protein
MSTGNVATPESARGVSPIVVVTRCTGWLLPSTFFPAVGVGYARWPVSANHAALLWACIRGFSENNYPTAKYADYCEGNNDAREILHKNLQEVGITKYISGRDADR